MSSQTNLDEDLYDMFKNKQTGLLPVGKFLCAMQKTGIRKTDPRFQETMGNFRELLKNGESIENLQLEKEAFKQAIHPNLSFIGRAYLNKFIIPDFQDFTHEIEDLYKVCKSNKKGDVACYIPQLAKANPDHWGIGVCTIDGQRFSIGDVNVPFTLQSCSKPLSYAMALDVLGPQVVHKYVGTEPSGRNFNELVLDWEKKPHNPMINAGAILICALLRTLDKPNLTLAELLNHVMSFFKRMAGNEILNFNNDVYVSEKECADRNYAIGYYMRGFNCFPEKTKLRECLDFYFQCCSMESTADSMAVMAATLANGGICPTTNEKMISCEAVRNVLSLMHSCGMYDYSGKFAFSVGLPAKSGVSGAMLIVIPNVMGISTYSPPLDTLGNSCRGLQFCIAFIDRFSFHIYDTAHQSRQKKDPRRNKYDGISIDVVSLLYAAANGDICALKRYHLSGMNMRVSDYDNRTALHLAAVEGQLACVDFLLNKCGADPKATDRWGKRPVDEAEAFGHQNVAEFLKKWPTPLQGQQSTCSNYKCKRAENTYRLEYDKNDRGMFNPAKLFCSKNSIQSNGTDSSLDYCYKYIAPKLDQTCSECYNEKFPSPSSVHENYIECYKERKPIRDQLIALGQSCQRCYERSAAPVQSLNQTCIECFKEKNVKEKYSSTAAVGQTCTHCYSSNMPSIPFKQTCSECYKEKPIKKPSSSTRPRQSCTRCYADTKPAPLIPSMPQTCVECYKEKSVGNNYNASPPRQSCIRCYTNPKPQPQTPNGQSCTKCYNKSDDTRKSNSSSEGCCAECYENNST